MSNGDKVDQSNSKFQIGYQKNINPIQSFEQSIKAMEESIDASSLSSQEKTKIKDKFKEFLKHPLIVKILGGVSLG